MQRRHVLAESPLSGYDALQTSRVTVPSREDWSFVPNQAYDAYFRMHKVFVGETSGKRLENIAEMLEDEWMPRYLNVAGWALAEAALVETSRPAVERVALLDEAVVLWQRALTSQEQIHSDPEHEWLREDSAPYRLALDIAYAPLMKALVVGDVTAGIREQVFADTLAIAQAASVQTHLAFQAGNKEAGGDLLGFGHECNALLTLLYMNDPRHIPIPSPARAGSGYDYPDQTHDIVVINQHWGNILKAVPVEIKAKPRRSDLERYMALIVRGKMHLAVPGKYTPDHTLHALTTVYEGTATVTETAMVEHIASTMHNLLKLYQRGKRVSLLSRVATRFHDASKVREVYHELSPDRSFRKSRRS